MNPVLTPDAREFANTLRELDERIGPGFFDRLGLAAFSAGVRILRKEMRRLSPSRFAHPVARRAGRRRRGRWGF